MVKSKRQHRKPIIQNGLMRKVISVNCVTLILLLTLFSMASVPTQGQPMSRGDNPLDPIPLCINELSGDVDVFINETVTLWVTAHYSGGVASAQISIDGINYDMINVTYTGIPRFEYNYTAPTTEGTHTYLIEVFNNEGNSVNSSEYQIVVLLPIDLPIEPATDDLLEINIENCSGDVTVSNGDSVTLWVEVEDSEMEMEAYIYIDTDESQVQMDLSWLSPYIWEYEYVGDEFNHTYTISVFTNHISTSCGPYNIVVDDHATPVLPRENWSTPEVDISGPTIFIRNPSPGNTTYDLTPRIKVVYYDPSGVDTESVVLTVDGNVITPTFIGPHRVVLMPSSNMTIGEHHVILEVSDIHGNPSTAEWSFTILESESRSEEEVGDIPAGEQTEVDTNETEETCVDTIGFTPENDLEEVRVIIVRLNRRPEDIIESPRKDATVYEYLDLKITASDEYLNDMDARIRIKVRQKWVEENNIDLKTIKLMRYHDDIWEELNTTLLVELGSYVYFIAETPGFSTFAVVGTTEVIPTYTSDKDEIPLTTILIIISAIAIFLAVVLFKSKYIYYGEETIIEKSKKKIKKENK